MSTKNQRTTPLPLYKIGAVSNITGLTTHSIRAWENRYNLKLAQRSEGNTRLYTDRDIVLLSLLRGLTKRGDSIGEIAGLSEEVLRERLKHYGPTPVSKTKPKPHKELMADSSQLIRAMVLGDTLADYLSGEGSLKLSWQVQCKAPTPEDALAQLDSEDVDVLMAHIQTLGTDPLTFLEQWNEKTHNAPAIVFYDLSNSALFAELVKLGAKMVKWPVDPVVLSQMVMDYSMLYRLNRMKGSDKGPELEASPDGSKRLFSDAQLMKLCQDSTRIDCDYLKNIASLLFEINSLEAYFKTLSSGSEEDRTLHLELYQKTAKARALLESMLTAACAHEKLEGL